MDATLTARAKQLAREMATSAGTIDELNALMRTMMKSALERMLDAEMDHHLSASRAAARSTPAPATAVVPDGLEHADFHSLRHSVLTMLERNGVDLRTAQELAGHSTRELTARYFHVRLTDMTGAVGKLPSCRPRRTRTSLSCR